MAAGEATIPCNACSAALIVSSGGSVRLETEMPADDPLESEPPRIEVPEFESPPQVEPLAHAGLPPHIGVAPQPPSEPPYIEAEPQPPSEPVYIEAAPGPPSGPPPLPPVQTSLVDEVGAGETDLWETAPIESFMEAPLDIPVPTMGTGSDGADQNDCHGNTQWTALAETAAVQPVQPAHAIYAQDMHQPEMHGIVPPPEYQPEPPVPKSVMRVEPRPIIPEPIGIAVEPTPVVAPRDTEPRTQVESTAEMDWSVNSLPGRGYGGRAGTVPMDEAVFRREARSGRMPMVVAALALFLTGTALWAAGIVRIPGLPVPGAAREPVEIAQLSPIPEPVPTIDSTSTTGAVPTTGRVPTADIEPSQPISDDGQPYNDVALDGNRGKRQKQKKGRRKGKGREDDVDPADDRPLRPAPTVESGVPQSPAVPPPPVAPSAPSKDAAADLHYKQGNLYLREKKVALAIDELKECLAANPQYGLAYRSLGVAYMLLGREKSAVQAYEQFVKVSPSHRDTPKVKQIISDYYARNPR
ncbi:MAG: hypothetical protein A2289_11880 [Deltaproteobacteria bacterium RIFOXYA12_FULL_58_15]|nr:MAG: hypothetical protein A2289_11880 [Deltaproteobacteria bacterium RIFOXYA12_FULL_58_15]